VSFQMARQIIWSPRSANDLEEICEYIAKDSEYYAREVARQMHKRIDDLPGYPRSGRVVPEYDNENLREKIYKSYRIVYRIKPGIIEKDSARPFAFFRNFENPKTSNYNIFCRCKPL